MGKRLFYVVFILTSLMLSGCGRDPEVQLVEISRNTVVYDEIVRLNNCGGKGDSDHTATREFATTIEFGTGISAGYKSVVEGDISAKYREYRNNSKSIRAVAPPGTNMEFVLRWSDDVRAGNVQVNGKTGTYEVRIPISVEQISSRDLGCGVVSSPSHNQTTPPSTQQAAAQPSTQLINHIDRFRVIAATPKNRTGIGVNTGDVIHIEYLDGQWTGERGKQPLHSGCGFYDDKPYPSHIYPLDPKQGTGAALIGYIGNQAFLVGCESSNLVATISGELYLGMNDCQGCFWDNEGEIYVRISITRK